MIYDVITNTTNSTNTYKLTDWDDGTIKNELSNKVIKATIHNQVVVIKVGANDELTLSDYANGLGQLLGNATLAGTITTESSSDTTTSTVTYRQKVTLD